MRAHDMLRVAVAESASTLSTAAASASGKCLCAVENRLPNRSPTSVGSKPKPRYGSTFTRGSNDGGLEAAMRPAARNNGIRRMSGRPQRLGPFYARSVHRRDILAQRPAREMEVDRAPDVEDERRREREAEAVGAAGAGAEDIREPAGDHRSEPES